MKRIKSSGTKLEKNFSLLIHQAGLKYRSQPNLFGKPDFKIVNSKVIIFCDSSFWHGRRKNELNGNAFTRNKKLWIDKLQRNKKRAIGVNRKLKKDGWIVLRFWDNEIKKEPIDIINKLKTITANEKK